MKKRMTAIAMILVVMILGLFAYIRFSSKGVERDMNMIVTIGDKRFEATLQDNKATDELIQMMEQGPIELSLQDYSGFEKVGALGRQLSTSDKPMRTSSGDIVLYGGNNIVMLYGSHSWSYTKLARINDLTGWEDALGKGNVRVTLSLE